VTEKQERRQSKNGEDRGKRQKNRRHGEEKRVSNLCVAFAAIKRLIGRKSRSKGEREFGRIGLRKKHKRFLGVVFLVCEGPAAAAISEREPQAVIAAGCVIVASIGIERQPRLNMSFRKAGGKRESGNDALQKQLQKA